MKHNSQEFGPWALVTGANSGIGAAFADKLASQGYNIVLVGRRVDALRKSADALEKSHAVQTRTVSVDLSSPDFLAQITEHTGDLDVGMLVSNAGDDAMGALLRIDLPDLTRMLRLNTQSHLELVHHFGRLFQKRGKGGILLVSSTAGLQGTPFLGNYAASKSYILNLGMALNYEMRGTGVNVTVLVPGPTKTPGLTDKPAIPLTSLPAPKMDAAAVAKIGLRALAQNKPYVIAGIANRMMAGIGTLLGKVRGRNMWGGLLKGIVPEDLKIS